MRRSLGFRDEENLCEQEGLFCCLAREAAHKPFIPCLAFSYWLKAIKISLQQEQSTPPPN